MMFYTVKNVRFILLQIYCTKFCDFMLLIYRYWKVYSHKTAINGITSSLVHS